MDEFSKKVKTQFIQEFPKWEEFCSTAMDEDEVVFSAKIPNPSGDEDHPLSVDTFRGEVTVAFDAYHAHFYDFIDPEDEDAASFIKKLISGDRAVVSYWRDDQWCGSNLLPFNELPTSNEDYPYANIIRFRSWSGKYNNEISCTPRD
ncbi:hypothetical protein [Microbulbifer sp. ALW1]|uniref:hypothetical protein n=1 Tax=Microbulbifer sp. (strain ALW1) TaxID=1516059 RepID=UPI00135C0B38|nr:hypothetical protein [Microbulbifer sp. ALW1]